MKCVIAFSCLLAVASAGYLGNGVAYTSYAAPLAYSTAYTAPIAYTAPKSFGYQTASVHPYGVAYPGYGYGYAAPVAHAYTAPLAFASEARQVDPVAIAAGAPLPTGDTVEVAAAKAKHFQAHAAAKGLAYSAYAPAVAYSGYVAPFASEARLVDPVAIAAGAPLPSGDTYEVAAAKAKHFQAHAAAKGIAYSGYSGYVAPFASEARLVDPVAIAAGAPLPTGDTVEVAAAKAAHFQAHAAAKSGHFITKRSPGFVSTAYTAPLAYTTPLAYSAPVHSYGYSAYASPLAYSAYSGYGYGHLGAYYG